MKILLDENLPRKLKADFGQGLEIHTVHDMGWLGKKNGELLALLAANDFDFFITIDKNLRFQQKLDKYDFKVILFNAPNNRRETLQKLVLEAKELIASGNCKKLHELNH